ncbi:MAG TPA: phospholipase D-like domain-containing protein [Myxococcaceae bacterium]|nr:phospholipase D-like domain-containing protein [Myxococcaceae bacterium]
MQRLAPLPLLVLAALACAPRQAVPAPGLASPAAPVQLVESSPIETNLDHADIADAKDVWLQMIGRATSSLDFAEFYASNERGSRLEPVIQAIEAAADRGVAVRFLAEDKFYATYPQTLDRLAGHQGIQVRRYRVAELMGGVLHAKYFIADGGEAFLGSQNFDWRSLEHIQELGVTVRVRSVVNALSDVFETDWALAGGADRDTRVRAHLNENRFPTVVEELGGPLRITPAFSPRGWLPDESLWDLPRLVEMIDSARGSIRVQLLTYRARDESGSVVFPELESALRRAADRGVAVELLAADWSKRKGIIEGLQKLHAPPRITVKLVTIPQWSGGRIPFARVIHAQYLVVDSERCWIGTSNWEKDYFLKSRNVGVIIESAAFAGRLARFFDDDWKSSYAVVIDPNAKYEPPHYGD